MVQSQYRAPAFMQLRCGIAASLTNCQDDTRTIGQAIGLRYRLWSDAERFLTMPQPVVWTISTAVLDLRETSDGTDPSSRPATLLSPTLPTTNRSAWTSSARCTSALIGAPTIDFSSTFVAPALWARSLASRRIA